MHFQNQRRTVGQRRRARPLNVVRSTPIVRAGRDVDHCAKEARVSMARSISRHALSLVTPVALALSLSTAWFAGAAPGAAAASRASRSTTIVSLPAPAALVPFAGPASRADGRWRPAGRRVHGVAAVYTTTLHLPGSRSVVAGVAWMDTRLLRARLYSGSLSPGGANWKFTAPISVGAATSLVAAFNGGFLMKDSEGGYFSEGRLVAPLRRGAASLVIYSNGLATVGQWGRDVSMTPSVIAVRQNLRLLVDHGRLVPGLQPSDVKTWGVSLNNVVNTPRSGLGVTANGALVYVEGPMNIVDLAHLLVRAGAVRAMVLDMNPLWPIFATYSPTTSTGVASPANGQVLSKTMLQTPTRFFDPAYSRDFVTMSAR
ncbi:MAG: phosphodiester glycosidase family protein [Acidimicrobiales bacterium]